MQTFITLYDWHVPEILLIAAVALVILDYFLPVDYLAFLGYLAFAAGMFFRLPLGMIASSLAALAIFVVLLLLHIFVWGKYLANIHTKHPDEVKS